MLPQAHPLHIYSRGRLEKKPFTLQNKAYLGSRWIKNFPIDQMLRRTRDLFVTNILTNLIQTLQTPALIFLPLLNSHNFLLDQLTQYLEFRPQPASRALTEMRKRKTIRYAKSILAILCFFYLCPELTMASPDLL